MAYRKIAVALPPGCNVEAVRNVWFDNDTEVNGDRCTATQMALTQAGLVSVGPATSIRAASMTSATAALRRAARKLLRHQIRVSSAHACVGSEPRPWAAAGFVDTKIRS